MVSKEQFEAFIASLMKGYRLIAPVRKSGELRFREVASPDDVVLDYRNTVKAPKAALFPQVECMIRFDQPLDRFNEMRDAPEDTTPTIILGIRPCDVRGLLLFDKVFIADKYVDLYYQSRREHALVFSLACDHPRPTCFCHAFGSGPYDCAGSDVIMSDASDAYLLEPVSERGKEALGKLTLAVADPSHLQKSAEVRKGSEAHLSAVEPVEGIKEMLATLYESKVWARIAEKCIACGTCTFVCPGCHCFNIEDRVLAHGGERVRAWDGCMFPNFTLQASGNNPRPDQASRWRQRTMHKFAYLPLNVQHYGCVGCGRCILSCPVRLDIREVLRQVRAAYASAAAAKVQASAQESR
jgi:ferredoxin